jgi:hypothetical protein
MTALSGRSKVVVVIGAVWIAVSLAVYLLVIDEAEATQRAALFCLIASEVVTTIALARLESSEGPAARRVGFYGALTVYLVLAAGLAVLHLFGFIHAWTYLLVGETVLLAALFTVLYLIHQGQAGVSARDLELMAESSARLDLLGRLERLTLSPAIDPPDKTILKKVVEDVRFFDRGIETPADAKMEAKVTEIEALLASPDPKSGDGQGLGRLIDDLHALTQKRRQEAGPARRGGY